MVRREAAEERGEARDGGVEVGTNDADTIDRGSVMPISRGAALASKSVSSVVGSITTPCLRAPWRGIQSRCARRRGTCSTGCSRGSPTAAAAGVLAHHRADAQRRGRSAWNAASACRLRIGDDDFVEAARLPPKMPKPRASSSTPSPNTTPVTSSPSMRNSVVDAEAAAPAAGAPSPLRFVAIRTCGTWYRTSRNPAPECRRHS